ncbi:MAG: universal stress protein [Desulfobacteraceae bacterium]|jgi:nucleotide-binding universal stress UspA family protein|nr:universal stress protein [Desulfobacteraceae bacterium]
MFKNILIAVDGSEYSNKALAYAQDMAQTYRATLWLVHVFDHPPDLLGYDDFEKIYAKRKCAGQSILDAATERLGESDLEAHPELCEGPEAESIINCAKNSQADLIIMGTRGMGGIKGLLLGSVSRKVIHYATCPVMVVH